MLATDNLSKIVGCNLFLKLELLQRCKAFKFRGALNKMTQLKEGTTVCAVSAGNHSQGLALAATLCGCKSIIYMPENAPSSKVQATQQYGGIVVKKGATFDLAKEELFKAMKENPDWVFVSPYDDKDIIAGTGTIGLEINEQMKDHPKYTVVVPIGGGGLISGVAYTLKKLCPDVRIIGVNMASCATTCRLWCEHHKKPVPQFEKETRTPLADGIAVKTPGDNNMPIIYKCVDDVVVVNDDEVALAIALLAERTKLVTEGAGAASFAAVLSKKFQFASDENVVCILSGGNITLNMLRRCMQRALFLRGSRVAFNVILPCGTGHVSKLLDVIRDVHGEVFKWSSQRHVAHVANKDSYQFIVDLPKPEAMDTIRETCDMNGWFIKNIPTAAIE